jgi:polysaccharide biosynthesis/export protein
MVSSTAACFAVLSGTFGALGADPQPNSAEAPSKSSNVFFSARAAGKRAAWQQHMTVGPGDTFNISIFDLADTARTEVPVAPDGRLTYLQARNIPAAGLTIDELRTKLDEELGKFYQNPRTVIIPVAVRSKKYFLLGAVVNRGVYPLDRPVTVIEALARAGGMETGLSDQRTVELADLSHTFLARSGHRVPVDFERLFQRGDLSQNVTLEPDDYLYFASATANEIYVLGEVGNPGVLMFSPRPTALNAIASRGGFSPRAWQGKVLVVRGSLDHPQTFEVDTGAIISGKTPDFALQAHDIVYVSTNPWKVAAEVLDVAARAFVQSLIVEGTTLRIPAAIK